MEITNRGVNSTPLRPQAPVETAAPASSESAAPSASPAASSYSPSAELVRLLGQVRAQPAVRADRVQAATERLQQGYYQTPASAVKTAEAMCQDRD